MAYNHAPHITHHSMPAAFSACSTALLSLQILLVSSWIFLLLSQMPRAWPRCDDKQRFAVNQCTPKATEYSKAHLPPPAI